MAPAPIAQRLQMQNGLASGMTNGAGVLTATFPKAFTTACAGVLFMPNQNKGAPVLVEAGTTKTNFEVFFAGAASQSRSIQYIAFGY